MPVSVVRAEAWTTFGAAMCVADLLLHDAIEQCIETGKAGLPLLRCVCWYKGYKQ